MELLTAVVLQRQLPRRLFQPRIFRHMFHRSHRWAVAPPVLVALDLRKVSPQSSSKNDSGFQKPSNERPKCMYSEKSRDTNAEMHAATEQERIMQLIW
ncbi:hypothetical protein Bca4012_036317 [Brassica carinata]